MARCYLKKCNDARHDGRVVTTILKTLVIFFLASFITWTTCFSFDLYRLCYQPMPLTKGDTVIFRVDQSTSANKFAQMLQSQHLIRSSRVFSYLIRLQGLAKQLKAGIYQITPGESAKELLDRVVANDVLKENFSIIEGTTQKQVAMNLAKAIFLNYRENDWNHAICHSLKPNFFAISCDDQRKEANLEGLFLADTYQYRAGSDATSLLKQAHELLKQYLFKTWSERDASLPYQNSYELLIVASILEKETASSTERRLISGVIMNRLKYNMPLQMDPTVIYGLGTAYTGKLSHDDLQIDSPYNSYRYRGLPPTPITMVGKDAIDAAAHPTQTDDLYFVAKGDGTHVFSKTYEAQRQAIERYLKKRMTP